MRRMQKIVSLALTFVMLLSLAGVLAVGASATGNKATIAGVTFVGKKDNKGDVTMRNDCETAKAYDGDIATSSQSFGFNGYTRHVKFENGAFSINYDTAQKYYCYYKIELSALADLTDFTIWGGSDKKSTMFTNDAYDVLVSADGASWKTVASFSDLTGTGSAQGANCDTYYTETWDKTVESETKTYYGNKVDLTGETAKYIAVAVVTTSKGNNKDAVAREFTVNGVEAAYAYDVDQRGYKIVKTTEDFLHIGDNKAANYVLANDLTFTSNPGSSISGFSGILDGNGKTVYGLTGALLTVSGGTVKNLTFGAGTVLGANSALFGTTIEGGTFENIVNNLNGSASSYHGLFARDCNGTVRFENCINNGNITCSTGGNYKVGGFVGRAKGNVTFTNCENNGNIQGNQVGGFIGIYNNDVSTYTFTNCVNRGNISALSGTYNHAGGFFGSTNNANAPDSKVTWNFTDCINYGNISAANDSFNDGASGFIGWLGNDTDTNNYTISFTNCGNMSCTITAGATKASAAGFISRPGLAAPSGAVVSTNPYNIDVTVTAKHTGAFVGNNGANYAKRNSVKVDATALSVTADAAELTDLAYQKKIAADGATYDFRFVAKLNLPAGKTLEDYSKVGFRMIAQTADGNRMWYKDSETVYSSILANEESVSAGENAYWIVTTLQKCPATSDITFSVQPYYVDENGEILYGAQGSSGLIEHTAVSTSVKVFSYNLKDGEYKDKQAYSVVSSFSRLPALADNVEAKDPDIVMVSESHTDSNGASCSRLAAEIGGDTYGYVQTAANTYNVGILYRKSMFTVVESGEVFICEDTTYGCNRGIVYAVLQRTDGVKLLAISLHGSVTERKYIRYVADWVEENYEGYRVVMAGDTNANQTSSFNWGVMTNGDYGYTNADVAYETYVKKNRTNSWYSAYPNPTLAEIGTVATFPEDETILDWCYFKGFTGSNYEVVTSAGTDASDHYPIYVQLTLK